MSILLVATLIIGYSYAIGYSFKSRELLSDFNKEKYNSDEVIVWGISSFTFLTIVLSLVIYLILTVVIPKIQQAHGYLVEWVQS